MDNYCTKSLKSYGSLLPGLTDCNHIQHVQAAKPVFELLGIRGVEPTPSYFSNHTLAKSNFSAFVSINFLTIKLPRPGVSRHNPTSYDLHPELPPRAKTV